MRATSLMAVMVVAACGAGSLACSSSKGGASGAAGAAGTAGTTGAGGSAGGGSAGSGGGASGTAGTTGAGGAAGGTAVRDCLPACIVALRGTCERPAIDAGACLAGPGGHCYANGVRETVTPVDGGQLNVYTKPDGQTICYQVFSDGVASHFLTPGGVEVAQGRGGVDGGYEVTCDGMTVVVDINDPSCATQNQTNCVAGACP